MYPTVDIAVFRNNKTEILLGKKSINNKWRLVGGFADPTDESFAYSAKRELTEECGLIEIGEMVYETSAKINDWRYRNEADKIISLLFSCDHVFGTPTAQDDIADLHWLHLSELPQIIADGYTTEEHTDLLNFLIHKYLKTL